MPVKCSVCSARNTYYFPITKTVTADTLDATLASMNGKPDSYFLGQWLSEPELDALFTP